MQTIPVCDLLMNYSLWPRGSQNTQKVSQHQKLHKLARRYTLKGEAERAQPWSGEKKVATVDFTQKLQGCLCKDTELSKHQVSPQPKTRHKSGH